ncbi:hypothetical protein BD779DRAFT_1802132 [Infundibulicybe gibba]|nr:hypothetical protein BD779DRAFT_1802132 [Infundibulicybe gibba]
MDLEFLAQELVQIPMYWSHALLIGFVITLTALIIKIPITESVIAIIGTEYGAYGKRKVTSKRTSLKNQRPSTDATKSVPPAGMSRSKSTRSPIPPSALKSGSSPRPFLPPSHYAAAGGLSYPRERDYLDTGKTMGDFVTEFSSNTRSNLGVSVPTSYPQDFAASDSSLEFRPDSDKHFRRAKSVSQRAPSRENRQSQMAGLPMLEAQLLPSLRDTIDRMTRPPSRVSSGPSARSTPSLHGTDLQSKKFYSPSVSGSMNSNHYAIPPTTPQLASEDCASPSALLAPTTPRLRPPQYILKSSLRTPTPKKISGDTPRAETPTASPSVSATLKSVRSILGRKSSNGSLTPCIFRGSGKESKPKGNLDVSRPGRTRSRTDPGTATTSHDETLGLVNNIPIPQQSTPNAKSCNIPRLKARSNTNTWARYDNTDDSDLEYRYETEGRNRRKLTVANAEVMASSSSSEDEVGIGTLPPNQTTHHRRLAAGPNQDTVGLGLNLDATPVIAKSPQVSVGNDWHHYYNSNPESPSSMRDPTRREQTAPGRGLSRFDMIHERRREALLNIVSGIEIATKSDTQVETDDSEYCGEDGFAVSGSQDMENIAEAAQDSPDDESIYDEERLTLHRTKVSKTERQGRLLTSAGGKTGHDKSKPSSRAPIIRSSEWAAPTTSRRTSAYGSPAIPNGVSSQVSALQASPLEPPRGDGHVTTQQRYSLAARERQALGIPPSESDEVHQQYHQDISLSRTDSNLSSIANAGWQNSSQELSIGAEALFRTLSGGHTTVDPDRRSAAVHNEKSVHLSTHGFSSTTIISASSSDASVYDDEECTNVVPEKAFHEKEKEQVPHHSTPNTEVLDSNAERQGVIQELCDTEKVFVCRMRLFVQLFILPLRAQNSKVWISGVPTEVARLFDWLEDIANLHSQILSSLLSQTSNNDVDPGISNVIQQFIPRLEVYQPYLARLAEVSKLVTHLSRDTTSDFGEFVSLQQRTSECDGWKLEQLLLEPVNRLAKYKQLFARLLDLTPKNHPEYVSTFTLVHRTNMVIKIMTDVKVREDEYELMKDLCSSIKGIPQAAHIASRERRILAHGTLRLFLDTEEIIDTQGSRRDTRDRSARLVDAVNAWDFRRERSGSIKSTSSSNTEASFGSQGTFFSLTADPKSPPPLPGQPRKTDQSLGHDISWQLSGGSGLATVTIPVQVLVFSDLLLLASSNSTPVGTDFQEWALLGDIGLCRLLDVTESSGHDIDAVPIVSLECLPIATGDLAEDLSPQNASSVRVIRFALCSVTNSLEPSAMDEKSQQTWLSALHQCRQSTLKSISLSLFSGSNDRCPPVKLNPSVSSGLPPAKSPSMQLIEIQERKSNDPTQQEQEERGWWSLRFKQVLQETLR